ncbi:MAG: hypothetical protein QF368_18440, partial [SAR202 cluster bacterium]|nr:hypothetical protein [SAR202 cluster bacterium]
MVDFTLDVGGTISGYVYGPDGMTPVSGVQIGAWHDGISDWHGPTWTEADGSYVLTVPAGQHKVLASPQVSGQTEFPNMWHGGASVRAKATLVPVTAPNNTPGANFVLGVDDASSNVSDPLVGPTPSGSGVLYVNEEADFLSVAMKLGEMEIIDFEALPDGSTLNSGDTVIGDEFSALGVTFEVTELPGNSLQTCTPPIAGSSNSLSPGACPNIGGDASQDDLVIRFDPPVVAAGFRIIDNGGGAGESVTFLDMSGRVINKVERLPNVWVGSISAEAPIAEIRIVEMANDGDDVNYDDIMFVQGPVALLSENFESAAGGWTFNMSNWIVGRDDGDYFLSGLGHHTATYLPGAGWDDYRLELSVKLIGPATHINVRSSEIGRYFVGFDMNGIGLSKQIRPDTFFPNLARANFPVAPDVWHKIAITVFDNRIMIAVDGVERINYTDQEPILSQGTIGLEPLHDENAHVLYDDITVIEATDTGVMAAPPAPAPAPMPVAPVSSEPRTATISGQVFDVDGVTPMEGVLMRAEGGGIFGWADSRHTGADGSFTLEVPPGQYRVVACTPCTGQLDYYEYWHENTGDPLSATFVSVDNQTPATGLVYTLDSIGDATGWPMIAAATSTYIQDWENGPQGWFGKHGPNDPVVLVDDPTAPSGSMVQQLTRRTGAGDYFSPLIPVTSGQTYCAGAWIKWLSGARPFVGFDGYDHGRRDGRYWLIGREGYGSSLGGNDTVTPVLADIDEWRWHEKQFTIGFGDSLIRLTNELSGETVKPGPDLAYFDDLSVRLGQCDGQPTSVRTRASVDERIVFTSDRDGNKEIYTMNLDGSGVSRNTDHGAADGSPSLSPDGKRIAFVSNRDDDYEIYVMSDDGSGQTRLTDSPSIDGSPSWSPDGSRIAFTSLRDGNWEIYVMNADGSDPLNLTDNPAVDLHPSWSPDGVSIAFSSDRDGSGEIYTMTPDGTDQTRLTNNVS